eukprot:6708283-Prorocentrum_lima.AAC.1
MFEDLAIDRSTTPVGFTYLRCVNIGATRKRSANVRVQRQGKKFQPPEGLTLPKWQHRIKGEGRGYGET